jgi:hypothetical protein
VQQTRQKNRRKKNSTVYASIRSHRAGRQIPPQWLSTTRISIYRTAPVLRKRIQKKIKLARGWRETHAQGQISCRPFPLKGNTPVFSSHELLVMHMKTHKKNYACICRWVEAKK